MGEKKEEAPAVEQQPFVACPAIYRLPFETKEREWGFYDLAELASCVTGILLAHLPKWATEEDRRNYTFDAKRLLRTFGFINESMDDERKIPGNEKKIRHMPYFCAQGRTGELPTDFLTTPCWVQWQKLDVSPVYVAAGWGNMVLDFANARVNAVYREVIPVGMTPRECLRRAFMGRIWGGVINVDRIVNKYYRCGKTAA